MLFPDMAESDLIMVGYSCFMRFFEKLFIKSAINKIYSNLLEILVSGSSLVLLRIIANVYSLFYSGITLVIRPIITYSIGCLRVSSEVR